jgi:hypothetical protein
MKTAMLFSPLPCTPHCKVLEYSVTQYVTARYKGEVNIKMGFKETGCDDMDWIELAQDRF